MGVTSEVTEERVRENEPIRSFPLIKIKSQRHTDKKLPCLLKLCKRGYDSFRSD